MRLVGFGSNRSRSVSIGDEFLKVFDDFGEETGDESAGQAKATLESGSYSRFQMLANCSSIS